MPKKSHLPSRAYEVSVEAVWMALVNEKIHGPLVSLNGMTGPWVASPGGWWARLHLQGELVNWLKEKGGETPGQAPCYIINLEYECGR